MTSLIKPPRACALILTFNSISRHGSLVFKAINSILSARSVDKVIVVDNNSTDSTIQSIEEEFGNDIKIFKLKHNYGYAGAHSLVSKLIKQTCRYVIILNDDYIVDPEGIEDILRVIIEREDLAIAQGINLSLEGGERVLDAGAFIDIHGNVIRRCGGLKLDECPPEPSYISLANGACMVVKLDKVLKLRESLFCRNYFMYAEDDELSLYLWSHGFKVVSVPVVAGFHKQGHLSNFSYIYLFRNRMLNIHHYYVGVLHSMKPLIILRYLARAISLPPPSSKHATRGLIAYLDYLLKKKRNIECAYNRGPYYPLILAPRSIRTCAKSFIPITRFMTDYINEISSLTLNDNMLKQSANLYIIRV
ncbi:MAG: glycosyltransferase family 2 protein [Desulfurococcus sp.]|nr:glycosyltransferase family 2 protein [Desulfurococcus sp.]